MVGPDSFEWKDEFEYDYIEDADILELLVNIPRRSSHITRFLLPCLLVALSLLTHTPTPPRSHTPTYPLSLAFVGDVMLGRDVARALDGDWPAAFAGVRPWLEGASLTFANLESPLTTAPFQGGRFDLRAPPEAVRALTAAGFDLVSLANNHALDGGQDGLQETLDTLNRAGITALVDPRLEIQDDPSHPHYPLSTPRLAALAFLDTGDPLDTAPVAQAAARADWVIVSMHWGVEYGPVTARQRALARELVAAGADLVIGHGPHVLQPVERIDGALVAYSLGNFVFDQPFPETNRGAILRVTLNRDSISAVTLIPTAIHQGRVYLATNQSNNVKELP